MIDILKFFGAPGSIPFLVVSLVLAVGLVRFTRRLRRFGAALVALTLTGYLVLALPFVAHRIANGLPEVPHEQPGRIETLIVLDGDNRRGRVRELQRVLVSDAPRTVWVLGDRWILNALHEAGVSGPQFQYDDTARTTNAQMAQVEQITAHASGTTAVIVSRLQAPRMAALIRSRKCPVVLLPSAVDAEPPAAGPGRFVPTYIALRLSRDAIYEHAALAYYRFHRFTTR